MKASTGIAIAASVGLGVFLFVRTRKAAPKPVTIDEFNPSLSTTKLADNPLLSDSFAPLETVSTFTKFVRSAENLIA